MPTNGVLSEREFCNLLREGAKLSGRPEKRDDTWRVIVIGYESLNAADLTPYPIKVQSTESITTFFNNYAERNDRHFRRDRKFGFILIDIVGYSKLSQDHQIALISRFQNLLTSGVMQETYRIQDVIDGFVPTGDGCFIVLSEQGIPSCLDIAEFFLSEVLKYNENDMSPTSIEIRTAVHVGLADYIYDISERWNYLGDGMNDVARIAGLIPSEDSNCIYISEEARKTIIVSDNFKLSEQLCGKDKHGKHHLFRRLIRDGDNFRKKDCGDQIADRFRKSLGVAQK